MIRINIGILELFTYIESQCESKEELAEEVNDLIMLSQGSHFSTQLNDYWGEYCETNNICTSCGSDIETKEYQDTEIIECQGFPCRQILHVKCCPNCGEN